MADEFNSAWRLIVSGDVVLPGGDVFPGATVLIQDGRIVEITNSPPGEILLQEEDVEIIDATDCWVTPGLIDQHLHGAFGVDFNQSSREEIGRLLARLPHYGITGILPTLISAPKLDLLMSLATMEEVIQDLGPHQCRLLGIHLEGPFLNPHYRGAHNAPDLLPATMGNLEGLISPSLKRLTLAPELDSDCQMVDRLVADGVLCSLGHSGADFAMASRAMAHGASCATHLFNAMAPMHHREPGIATACLLHDPCFVELILDGRHISSPFAQLVLRTKPFERVIVISDCNALTGMGEGASMQFGQQRVTVKTDGAYNEEGRLAGGIQLVTDGVRNLVRWNVLPFPKAVQLATSNPALHLGESPLFGCLAPGSIADLVLWSKADLTIREVFLGGERLEALQAEPAQHSA